MCLTSPNLLKLGYIPRSIQRKIKQSAKAGYWSERMIENRRKIVMKGVYKFAHPSVIEDLLSRRRSEQTDERLIEDFMTFEQPIHPVKRDYHYLRALRVTKQLFQPPKKLRPIHFPDQRYYPWTLNVSSEAPWTYETNVNDILLEKQRDGEIDNNRRSFHNLYNEIFMRNRLLIHLIKDGKEPFWKDDQPIPYEFTTLHARSHVVEEDEPDKIRAVFGVPKLLLMAEQHFIWPLQEQFLNQHFDSPMLWGNEIIKGGWLKLWNKIYSTVKPRTILSLDWSKFDKRALHEIIDDVHVIWREYFDFENGYVPTNFYPNSYTEPQSLENLWRWTCNAIKHTPILLPNSELYQWTRNGIASGFQQTQLLDSFVNMIMTLTLLSRTGINIEGENFFIKVQGDDSLVAFPENYYVQKGHNYLKELAKLALEYFNAKLSDTKSGISNDLNYVKVLGYSNLCGRPFREEADLLSHLLYPERSFGLPELAAAATGIAWASLGCSRTVYSICLDIHTYLTSKLGITPTATSLEWLAKTGFQMNDEYHIERFPSFAETFFSAYSVNERTEKMKNRLYPTIKMKSDDFIFLEYD